MTRSDQAERRPRVLVLNQYYWPGVEATANLLSELCSELARDFDISVITGMVRGSSATPGRSEREGVEVIRVRSSAFDRANLVLRGVNYSTYLVQALRAGLGAARPDVVMCMTDPPIIADVALIVARRFRSRLVVISQDVFPEIAVELGRLDNQLVIGLLRKMIRSYLERADRIIAIGDTMRLRLEGKGAPPDRIRVIPNWVDTEMIRPMARDNDWARENGLTGRFVVMHSGNVGHTQNLDSLVRAATFLRDLDDLRIPVIGTGARYADLVELAGRLDVPSVMFLPYQPRAVLPYSLSSADVHVIGLAHGLSGYVVPSRFYGVLAAGRPVIVAADAESETASIVHEVGCGVVIPPGRADLLAGAIRGIYEGKHDVEEMGRRGREYVVAEADRNVAMSRYREMLQELTRW